MLQHASPIAKRFNFEYLKFVMVLAIRYHDTTLPFDIVRGVPNFGDIPATGSHVASKRQTPEPHYVRRLIGSIRVKPCGRARRGNKARL